MSTISTKGDRLFLNEIEIGSFDRNSGRFTGNIVFESLPTDTKTKVGDYLKQLAQQTFYQNAKKRVENGDFSFDAISNMVIQHNKLLGYIK